MPSPNVLKIVLMLEETGLPYMFKWVNIWKGEQHGAALRSLNPNAKVPVVIDDDGATGKTLTIAESGAILLYLAEKSGRFLPAQPDRKYAAIQWMMIQMTGVGPIFSQYNHFRRFAPDGQDYAKARYTTEMLRLLDVFEDRLAAVPYLAGEDYSIADIATFPWFHRFDMANLSAQRYPGIGRWLDMIAARPAGRVFMQKAEELQAINAELRAQATPEDLDRLFGRGLFTRAL